MKENEKNERECKEQGEEKKGHGKSVLRILSSYNLYVSLSFSLSLCLSLSLLLSLSLSRAVFLPP